MSFSERMKHRGQQGGFTLIELLVVVAILAVLGGVAVFAVNGLGDDAGQSACTIEQSTLITAEAAADTEGGVPSDFLNDLSFTLNTAGTTDVIEARFWDLEDVVGGTLSANATENPNGDCTGI